MKKYLYTIADRHGESQVLVCDIHRKEMEPVTPNVTFIEADEEADCEYCTETKEK